MKDRVIKYTLSELENYCIHPEACIKKVKCIEPVKFSPMIFAHFESSILEILSRKIGRYDVKLNGIVLDFRNTKILSSQSGIRQDSSVSVINVATNFYVFAPQKGSIVTGVVKFTNRMSRETVISVLIYRVFNVKVTVKGRVERELQRDQEIQIRVKDFNFENRIPYIEGVTLLLRSFLANIKQFSFIFSAEVISPGIVSTHNKKLVFDDVLDSGISESSITSKAGPSVESTFLDVKIKRERDSSVEKLPAIQDVQSRKRSRKITESSDSDVSVPIKKIKVEPGTSGDVNGTQSLELNCSPKKLKKEKETTLIESSITSQSHPSRKEKKSKKKKRSRHGDDDFERSLQMIFSAAEIKQES